MHVEFCDRCRKSKIIYRDMEYAEMSNKQVWDGGACSMSCILFPWGIASELALVRP